MRARMLVMILLLALVGCGYHLPGRDNNLPEDINAVFIEIFVNKTTEPFLENRVTNAVTRRFSRKRDLRIEKQRNQADAILSGQITSYTTRPISYDKNDEIKEYRSVMGVTASLSRADTGKIIWKGNVSWRETYPANINLSIQEDSEKAAIVEISDRLSDEIFSRMLEDF